MKWQMWNLFLFLRYREVRIWENDDLLSFSDPLLSQRLGERGDHIALSQTGAKWEVAGSKKKTTEKQTHEGTCHGS